MWVRLDNYAKWELQWFGFDQIKFSNRVEKSTMSVCTCMSV